MRKTSVREEKIDRTDDSVKVNQLRTNQNQFIVRCQRTLQAANSAHRVVLHCHAATYVARQ